MQLRDKLATQEEAIIWPKAISLLPLRTCILTMCTVMERALGNRKQGQPCVSCKQTEFRSKETALYYLPRPNTGKYPTLPRRVVHVINWAFNPFRTGGVFILIPCGTMNIMHFWTNNNNASFYSKQLKEYTRNRIINKNSYISWKP